MKFHGAGSWLQWVKEARRSIYSSSKWMESGYQQISWAWGIIWNNSKSTSFSNNGWKDCFSLISISKQNKSRKNPAYNKKMNQKNNICLHFEWADSETRDYWKAFRTKKKKKERVSRPPGHFVPLQALTLIQIEIQFLIQFWHYLKIFHFGHLFRTRYEMIFQISNLIF